MCIKIAINFIPKETHGKPDLLEGYQSLANLILYRKRSRMTQESLNSGAATLESIKFFSRSRFGFSTLSPLSAASERDFSAIARILTFRNRTGIKFVADLIQLRAGFLEN